MTAADLLTDPDAIAAPAPQAAPRRRGRPPSTGPHPLDAAFGARVRARRILLGMSQERLGELLGLTFQQVQKYERGVNRVSIARACAIAEALQMPVTDLVAGIGAAAQPVTCVAGGATDRETLELARAIAAIPDATVRDRLRKLAQAIAGSAR